MGVTGISIWQLLIIAALLLVLVLIFRPIAKKAGYSGWWAVAMLIPIANIVVIWVFAFARWPAKTV